MALLSEDSASLTFAQAARLVPEDLMVRWLCGWVDRKDVHLF